MRELKNVLACAIAFIDSGMLEPRHLRFTESADRADDARSPATRWARPVQAIERVAIKQTLVQSAGNRVHAARALGIAVSTLYEKLRKYGL